MGFSAIGDMTLQEKYNEIRFAQINLVDCMPNLLSFFMLLIRKCDYLYLTNICKFAALLLSPGLVSDTAYSVVVNTFMSQSCCVLFFDIRKWPKKHYKRCVMSLYFYLFCMTSELAKLLSDQLNLRNSLLEVESAMLIQLLE